MDDSKDVGTIQWYVLIGAMLASPDVRKQAITAFAPGDVPRAFYGLWTALQSGNGQKVWEAVSMIGLPAPHPQPLPGATVAGRLIQELQERALRAFVEKKCTEAQFFKQAGLGADAVADAMESVAAAIRVRQAQITKPGKEPSGA